MTAEEMNNDGRLPDGFLDRMKAYLTEARECGKWSQFEFWLCPDLFARLGQDGARPVELLGARVQEQDAWSWGWMLMVKTPITPWTAFTPIEGTSHAD